MFERRTPSNKGKAEAAYLPLREQARMAPAYE